jgi:hypothetical protein
MPYFYKTLGQNMKRKTADKFLVLEGHAFALPVLAVIFVMKTYILIINAFYSVVANGYFLSISSQIFHH